MCLEWLSGFLVGEELWFRGWFEGDCWLDTGLRKPSEISFFHEVALFGDTGVDFAHESEEFTVVGPVGRALCLKCGSGLSLFE